MSAPLDEPPGTTGAGSTPDEPGTAEGADLETTLQGYSFVLIYAHSST